MVTGTAKGEFLDERTSRFKLYRYEADALFVCVYVFTGDSVQSRRTRVSNRKKESLREISFFFFFDLYRYIKKFNKAHFKRFASIGV